MVNRERVLYGILALLVVGLILLYNSSAVGSKDVFDRFSGLNLFSVTPGQNGYGSMSTCSGPLLRKVFHKDVAFDAQSLVNAGWTGSCPQDLFYSIGADDSVNRISSLPADGSVLSNDVIVYVMRSDPTKTVAASTCLGREESAFDLEQNICIPGYQVVTLCQGVYDQNSGSCTTKPIGGLCSVGQSKGEGGDCVSVIPYKSVCRDGLVSKNGPVCILDSSNFGCGSGVGLYAAHVNDAQWGRQLYCSSTSNSGNVAGVKSLLGDNGRTVAGVVLVIALFIVLGQLGWL